MIRTKRFHLVLGFLMAVVALELSSYMAIWLARPMMDEPIVRRATILTVQTQRIEQLLQEPQTGFLVLDSALGWRLRSGSDTDVSEQGLRGSLSYSRQRVPGRVRVAAFGDSFVYGSEVAADSAWPSLTERADSLLEVLNYGVPGYGVDQAYLRYLAEGTDFDPDIVLIGFAPVDLRRAVNVYRRFISPGEWPLTKPRFAVDAEGRLEAIPNPYPRRSDFEMLAEDPSRVRGLGQNDHWYEPGIYENRLYDLSASVRLATHARIRIRRRYFEPDRLVQGGVFRPESEAFRIQTELFSSFADAVRHEGGEPLVLMLPDQTSLLALRGGGRALYATLSTALQERGIPYLDAASAFQGNLDPSNLEQYFMPGGHYSPLGNRIVADWLARELAVY